MRMRSLKHDIESEERIRALEATCVGLQRQLGHAKAKTADLVAAVERGASEAALIVGKSATIRVPKRDKRMRGIEHALLHLTDFQMGKETIDYNSDVCERRVRLAVTKAVKIAEIHRADHPVPVCHVMLGGDLAENVDTFPLQAFEVDSTTFEQIFRASGLVEWCIITLLGHFESVEIWEVAGNHGRIGRKGQYPRDDNFDRIIGRITRERLTNQPRLTWHVPNNWYATAIIGNYRAMLVHGDQIKSWGGNVPHYGIAKKANAWASGVVEHFDDLYLGHMHQVLQVTLAGGGRAFMTGSPESNSEYAREFVGAKGEPSQRLHFVDVAAGRVSAEYVLWLD